ncbi:MAG: alpha/beta hydrolase [Paludibacteraceae bacterium]|nr:alpha/beta hydrolase [Paludibacteraceae bacterium]
MKKLFFIALAVWACYSCKPTEPQEDNTIYGTIIKQFASPETQQAIASIDPADKEYCEEKNWAYIEAGLNARGADWTVDPSLYAHVKHKVSSFTCGGYQVFTMGADNYDAIIIFVHGGAWMFNIKAGHFTICDDLITAMPKAKVFIPIYPLVPQANWKPTFTFLWELYQQLVAEGKPIYIMGDSAGGNIVLAFCQHLKNEGVTLPSKRILIAPVSDGRVADDGLEEVNQRDPSLTPFICRKGANLWRGDLEVTDWRISPLLGPLNDRIPTLIVQGTYDILSLQNTKLYNALVAHKCHTTLLYGEGLIHVYPAYNFPESVAARQYMAEFLLK